jgi:hypothetical protein
MTDANLFEHAVVAGKPRLFPAYVMGEETRNERFVSGTPWRLGCHSTVVAQLPSYQSTSISLACDAHRTHAVDVHLTERRAHANDLHAELFDLNAESSELTGYPYSAVFGGLVDQRPGRTRLRQVAGGTPTPSLNARLKRRLGTVANILSDAR